ncbi:MAG: hypothetical protein KGJ57_02045 [Sphingomonadales bacterium]|nr:hypothetical protein [Sphingomonadales bacterium]MDE2168192.1 hypothetical protein [Sphingomonadales bacterium]
MGVVSIFADGLGLMLGSLLGAAGLTFAAWWLADRLHRAWIAPAVVAIVVAAMLLTPLEASLLVRMMVVFAMVGAMLLWFVGFDQTGGAATQDHEELHGVALRHRGER